MTGKQRATRLAGIAALAVGWVLGAGARPSLGQASPPEQQMPAQMDEGIEVLTRGPVHEAFDQPINWNPAPGVVAPKGPPEPIEELPPEQQPEGAIWIPGYWSWDEEREDFIWVSGVWRIPPPGAQWVPGYWVEVEEGYQWIPGFWHYAQAGAELEYLAPPPESLETGPSSPPPSADYFWVPGSWVWYEGRYVWRPGYWASGYEDWVWVPAHYAWTPSGYIFIEGYWDYVPRRRGVLFAPVYFEQPLYARAGYYYSPHTLIDLGVLVAHLFVFPHHHHYYFGDYYADSYLDLGIYPWFVFHERYYGYAPIYAYFDWSYRRQGIGWSDRVWNWYRYVSRHEKFRPPKTFKDQQSLTKEADAPGKENLLLAKSIEELESSRDPALRMKRLDKGERQQLGQFGDKLDQFRQERAQVEARAAREAEAGPEAQPKRLKLPESPLEDMPEFARQRGAAPPPRLETPQPDLNVRRQPREVPEAQRRTQFPEIRRELKAPQRGPELRGPQERQRAFPEPRRPEQERPQFRPPARQPERPAARPEPRPERREDRFFRPGREQPPSREHGPPQISPERRAGPRGPREAVPEPRRPEQERRQFRPPARQPERPAARPEPRPERREGRSGRSERTPPSREGGGAESGKGAREKK